jgi:hypothetical protein
MHAQHSLHRRHSIKVIGYISMKDASAERHAFNSRNRSETDMEAIAAGSSIVAFIEIAASTCSAITGIVRRFRDAPEEFRQIARQLSLLYSELHFINDLRGEAGEEELALLPDEAIDLSKALQAAQTLIRDVQKACEKYKQDEKSGLPIRLRWAVHDQAKWKNIVSRLQQIQFSLHTILLLINMYVISSHKINTRFKLMISRIANLSRNAIAKASSLAVTSNTTLLQDVAAIRTTIEETRRQGKTPENIVLNGLVTRDPHDKNQFWKSMTFLEQSWLRFLGIEAVLSMYGNDYQTTYNLSGRYSCRLLGLRLICIDLRLRRFPIAGLGLSFISGGVSVKNVVPEDSEIMAACKAGDIISVKDLFRSRQASPNDVTPENSSPLRVS